MAVFEFRGVEVATGKAVKGFRDAENPKTLRMALRREGVMLTQATEESERRLKSEAEAVRRRMWLGLLIAGVSLLVPLAGLLILWLGR